MGQALPKLRIRTAQDVRGDVFAAMSRKDGQGEYRWHTAEDVGNYAKISKDRAEAEIADFLLSGKIEARSFGRGRDRVTCYRKSQSKRPKAVIISKQRDEVVNVISKHGPCTVDPIKEALPEVKPAALWKRLMYLSGEGVIAIVGKQGNHNLWALA